MFDFRIINLQDGTQVIDPEIKTPYESLTLTDYQECMEVDIQIRTAELLKRKEERRKHRMEKRSGSLLKKLISVCGLV